MCGCGPKNTIDGDWVLAMAGGGKGSLSLGKGTYVETVPALLIKDYQIVVTGNYDFDGDSLELIAANYKVQGPDKSIANQILQGFDASQSTPVQYRLEWNGPDIVYMTTRKGESSSVIALSRHGARVDEHRLQMSFSGSVPGADLQPTPLQAPTPPVTGSTGTDGHAPPPIPDYHPGQQEPATTTAGDTGQATETTGSTPNSGTTTGMIPPSNAPATTGGPKGVQPGPTTGATGTQP
jgi:hypothetical protein